MIEGKSIVKTVVLSVVGVLALITALSSYTTVSSGETVRIQNNISGEATWYTTEGIRLKAPFFSTVTTYSQEGTVAITDNKGLCETATTCSQPRVLVFSDTYGVSVEGSFRYSLPKVPEQLEAMHDKVKNSRNLFGTTLLPFSQDLLNYTASQFRAEYFMQGAQNEFKSRLIDQATFGMYITKREKRLVEAEVANRDLDRESGKASVGEQFVFEVIRTQDAEGNFKRTPTAISTYGITIVPSGINVVDYAADDRLAEFMIDKQKRVRARAAIIEDQENERQKAITAELEGNRKRIEQSNSLLIQKDAAVIRGEQSVEEARLASQKETVERNKVASLAIIDKKRELQVAQANEGIQRAAAVAAKYEAEAIKEKGFAEAAVDKAKYEAIDKQVLALEVDKAKALAMYRSNMVVNMPTVVSGSSESGNSLETMTTLNVMKMLGK